MTPEAVLRAAKLIQIKGEMEIMLKRFGEKDTDHLRIGLGHWGDGDDTVATEVVFWLNDPQLCKEVLEFTKSRCGGEIAALGVAP